MTRRKSKRTSFPKGKYTIRHMKDGSPLKIYTLPKKKRRELKAQARKDRVNALKAQTKAKEQGVEVTIE